jgi:outer membrane protein insertion porin family
MFQTSLKKPSKIFFLLIIVLISFTAHSQVKSYKILGISVQGNESTDAGTIISSSGIRIGDEIQIPGDKTLNAIKNLYALGAFSDVQIILDKEVGDGAFFIIQVEEYPRLERTVIEGNDELDTDEIEDVINFLRGTTLKPNEVANVKQRILKLYEEEGFLNAEINDLYYDFYRADTTEDGIEITWRNQKDLSDEHTVLYEDDDIIYTNLIDRIKKRVLLKLIIEENDEVVVREIEFYGNDAFDDDDLYGEMDEISVAAWWKFWSSSGYRDADIISDSLIYYNNNRDLKIVMEVYEGPQYKIRNVEWEGNTIYPDEVLTERLDFAKGDVFNYEKFQRNLFGNEQQSDVNALYQDNGYLTFRLIPSEIKVAPDSIDVVIRLEERNQFRIGQVKVEGNTKTKDKVIRRELYTIPGDYFNRALL